ncbi:MAG: right-handed parallel beta-helix repeat-containing protein [Candidatus Cloacimonetes bacterium]|nr:right-handed parallel beta-helix repeat-containing protein [Candidatus Cloacimonadota bacterium]
MSGELPPVLTELPSSRHREIRLMRNCLLLVFLLCRLPLVAEILIPDGASVSGVWTLADEPYIILREATVPEGESLVIEPGVHVLFNTELDNNEEDKGRLLVQGTLTAVGTAQNPITFTRRYNLYGWGALVFEDTSSENNQLIHCEFNHAGRYWDGQENIYGAVATFNSHVYLSYCYIHQNDHYGIAAREFSQVTIENCDISSNDWSGVYVRQGTEALIINSTISSNVDYGVYGREESQISLQDCNIHNNEHGVRCNSGTSIQAINCYFYSNDYGVVIYESGTSSLTSCQAYLNDNGGVYCAEASIEIVDCQIFDNGSYGIRNTDNYGALIQNCEIHDNGSEGIYTEFASNMLIIGNEIYGNGYCGIYSGEDGTPLIYGNDIYGNAANGIGTYRSTTAVQNNRIYNNGECGIYFYRWDDSSATGNILWNNGYEEICIHHHCFVTITNNTFIDDDNYAVWIDYSSQADITNCISTIPIISNNTSMATVSWSCIPGRLPPELDGGGNLFCVDPLLVDPAGGDFRLQSGSPCVDAGNPDMAYFTLPLLDPDGNPRIWPERIDMGAYELYTNLPPVITGWEPSEQDMLVDVGQSVTFTVHATDWEPLTFDWLLDGVSLGAADSTLTLVFDEPGFFIVRIIVSDGENESETRWTIHAGLSASQDPATPPLALIQGVNPCRAPMLLAYSLPQCTDVQIEVFDIRGRRVRSWCYEKQLTGVHALTWNGRDARGGDVGSGVYIVRLTAGGEFRHKKVTLLR